MEINEKDFDAMRCQFLILHSSLDEWFMNGAEVKKE